MTSRIGPVTPGEHPPRSGLLIRRVTLLILAGGTIALGLGVHWALPGSIGDFAADALYAVLIYLFVGILAPRASTLLLGAVSFLFCLGLELFQLTGIPLLIGDAFSPARLVLGTTFVTRDIIAYAIGAALITSLDAAVRRFARLARTA